MGRASRIGLFLAAWLAMGLAAAATPPDPKEVEQKKSFVHDLLDRSSIPRHIAEKGDAASRNLLDDARKAYRAGVQALAAKDIAKAERYLDEATRLISRASRATPDLSHLQDGQRNRYDMLHRGLEAMLKSYDSHVARLTPQQKTSRKLLDRQLVDSRKRYAEQLARSGDFMGAGDFMETLQDQVAAQLNVLIGPAVYVDKLKFDSPAQEYDYELNRFRSLADMLPMANAKFKPNPEVAARMKRQSDEGMSGYVAARQIAAKGDYLAAVQRLRQASQAMQHALELAGFKLQAPQEQ